MVQGFKIKKVTIKIFIYSVASMLTHKLCLSKLYYYEQRKLYRRHNRHYIMGKGGGGGVNIPKLLEKDKQYGIMGK